MAGFINFADEEEVRAYLENLHVEYSYQCFKEKDPDGKVLPPLPPAAAGPAGGSARVPCLAGCQRFADYLDAVRKDFVAAARVLRDNCEVHGHSESCYKLGAYQALGKGAHGGSGARAAGDSTASPGNLLRFLATLTSACPPDLEGATACPAPFMITS